MTSFSGGGTALAIMLVGQLTNAVAGPAGVVLIMTKHERAAAVGVGLGCLLNIVLDAVLVPPLGVNGAAIGTAASMVFWNAALAGHAALRMGVNTTTVTFSLRRIRRTARDTH